jgi:hypothetical protein
MSIKLRIGLLLGLLLLGFGATLLILRSFERQELNRIAEEDRRARAQLLNHWIDLTDRALPDFTAEVAQADEFATLLAASAEIGLGKIAANLEAANIDALWVVGADGKVRRQIASPKASVAPACSIGTG